MGRDITFKNIFKIKDTPEAFPVDDEVVEWREDVDIFVRVIYVVVDLSTRAKYSMFFWE